MAKLLTPLAPNVPIVDDEGNPTPYFQRVMQELSDAKINQSVLDNFGGDPGADRILVWDDSDGTFTFATTSEVLDWVGTEAHGDLLYRGASGWTLLPAGTSGQFLKTLGAGANPQWASGGGAFSLISSLSAPTSNAFTFTGLSLTSYSRVHLYLNQVQVGTDGAFLFMQFYTAGVHRTTAIYRWKTTSSSSGGVGSFNEGNNTADTAIRLTHGSTSDWGTGNVSSEHYQGSIEISGIPTGMNTSVVWQGVSVGPTTNYIRQTGHGGLDQTSVLDGIVVYPSTGTLTAGTAKLVGI